MAKKDLPDMLIPHADFVLPRNGVLLTWLAGKPVTLRADVETLVEFDAPADYFMRVKK